MNTSGNTAAANANKLTLCRQRVLQDTFGYRGRSGDPLFGIRRIVLTGNELLTDNQKASWTAHWARMMRMRRWRSPPATTRT